MKTDDLEAQLGEDVAVMAAKYPPGMLLPVLLEVMIRLVALTQKDPLERAGQIAKFWASLTQLSVDQIKGEFYGATQLGVYEKEIDRDQGSSVVRVLHPGVDVGAGGEDGPCGTQRGDPRRFR